MRILIAIVFVALLGGQAWAQSCSQLRSQLAAAQSGGPDRAALSRLQAQARAYGCNRNARFGQHRACAGIMAKIREARSGSSSGRVRQLRRRVQRVCNQEQRARNRSQGGNERARAEERSEPRNIFSALFNDLGGRNPRASADGSYRRGTQRVRPEAERERRPARQSAEPKKQQERSPTVAHRGVYRVSSPRTMCVRLCDGFYFPINRRSHYTKFYDELAMCIGRCPGADVSLYAHNRSAPVETMRSTMTGERYVDLPTAFLYRRKKVEGCDCEPATMMAEDASARKVLASVGLAADDEETAAPPEGTAVASVAAGDAPKGTRLSAVYDATGEPLYETLRKLHRANLREDGALPPGGERTGDGRGDDAGRADPGTAVADNAGAVASARGGGTDVVEAGSKSLRVRQVGPRFFSAAGPGTRRRRRILSPSLTSTAVRLVPVAASAGPQGPGAQGSVPAGSDAPDAAAERPPGDAARTSSLPGERSGG